MLYVKLSGGEVVHQCNYCSSSYEHGDSRDPIIETNYMDDRAKYHHLLTPLVHEDPTLPRVSDVACPNKGCTRKHGDPPSVLYIKYDVVNLRFLYSCTHCRAFWGPDELGVFLPGASTSPEKSPSRPKSGAKNKTE